MLLRAQWSLDTFLSIFKFAKDTIDFRASDKRVERWCKGMFSTCHVKATRQTTDNLSYIQ